VDKKSRENLKWLQLRMSFILMTSDKTTVGANLGFGGTQAIKTGLGYKY
jgi:hypothetical protein